MDLYRNRYRVESTRLKDWDYSSSGYYFVTICTEDKICFFGDITNGDLVLSEIGKIVAKEWKRTEQIRKYVELDEWIIMPNHIHGIVIIQNNDKNTVETTRRVVSTLKSNSLGSIIGQFKSVTAKRIHEAGCLDFAWQSRFYDHIIRSENSLQKIREYIKNNPIKWDIDENNPAFVKR